MAYAVLILVIGAAAGYFATRLYNIETSIPVTVGIGVIGAVAGYFILRFIGILLAAAGGILSLFVGGVLGAIVVVYIYKTYFLEK
ncbi:MAG: GlsB/YeaQ/YmgE family stress response membrane protein [Pseudomonadota bacterium]